MSARLHPLTTVAEILWGEDAPAYKAEWLRTQLVAQKIPGRKVGRSWRMTNEDIDAALEVWLRQPNDVLARTFGLTPNSRKRTA